MDDEQGRSSWPGKSELARLIEARLSRRDLLKISAAGLAGALGFGAKRAARGADTAVGSTLGFAEIAHAIDATHHVPPGYKAQVLIGWGDALFSDSPAFVPGKADAAAQARQFGYNNDFLAFMPLPWGSTNASHALLCANHEFCSTALMWPAASIAGGVGAMSIEQCRHEMAAQGVSVAEIKADENGWRVISGGRYNRRITAHGTPIRISGPAAGHRRMRTSADPEGRLAFGTFANCAGGETPWGTLLSCEENIHGYFVGRVSRHPEAAALKRYRFGKELWYAWGHYFERFNFDKQANEPNRCGWVVEIDPYEPQSTPVKRTALGRFKHEGATTAVSHDRRVAVYMGDDEHFEYLYKFVTAGKFVPNEPAANRALLDAGTLYVARFENNGKMRWLPLVHGAGPLTAAHGFSSQADVVIEARRAADLLGATSMDRPEDVETNPASGRVYAVLTKNDRRTPEQVNAANPRPGNRWGHIIELVPPRVDGVADHTATECDWEFFVIAGDPSDAKQSARYLGPVSANGWLACPDNVTFDPRGRIWIATDGQDDVAGIAESVYAADTAGPGRGITRLFFNGPRGAEICGPCFAPDGKTLFVAVQHPGDEKGSSFDAPSTRWPDFKDGVPPRPAVLAITRNDGGEIGS